MLWRLDWCDSGCSRCQLKTCWYCRFCWCWHWRVLTIDWWQLTAWQQLANSFSRFVWDLQYFLAELRISLLYFFASRLGTQPSGPLCLWFLYERPLLWWCYDEDDEEGMNMMRCLWAVEGKTVSHFNDWQTLGRGCEAKVRLVIPQCPLWRSLWIISILKVG